MSENHFPKFSLNKFSFLLVVGSCDCHLIVFSRIFHNSMTCFRYQCKQVTVVLNQLLMFFENDNLLFALFAANFYSLTFIETKVPIYLYCPHFPVFTSHRHLLSNRHSTQTDTYSTHYFCFQLFVREHAWT